MLLYVEKRANRQPEDRFYMSVHHDESPHSLKLEYDTLVFVSQPFQHIIYRPVPLVVHPMNEQNVKSVLNWFHRRSALTFSLDYLA